MKAILISVVCLFSLPLLAQPYVDGGRTRHRFAQLNFGIDARLFTASGSETTFANSAGLLEKRPLGNHHETRLIIGGTHFWGHADFYVAFTVWSKSESNFKTGVETGARYFPFRIQHKKFRPFIGVSWVTTSFKQGNGVYLSRNKFPASTGFVFNYRNHLFEIGAGYNYNNSDSYYINRTTSIPIRTQPFWISAGYKFMIETTVGAERNWQNGRTKAVTDTLSKYGRLNGFTLGVGPSSAMFLRKSSHNKVAAPYIDNPKSGNVFPEFSIGYYLHRSDLQFNLSYRRITSEIGAYGFSQKLVRKAVTFETYKFLGDYHGFVPFAGLAFSYEDLSVRETDITDVEISTFKGVKPGIVFGWDIRPDRLQSWYLRTNLRWFPGLNVNMKSGGSVSFDQLEFNFIQLVIFPERFF